MPGKASIHAESSGGTAKGIRENHSEFFPLFCSPQANNIPENYSMYLAFTSLGAQLWKRQGDRKGCAAEYRACATELGAPKAKGLTATPHNRDFNLFSLLQALTSPLYTSGNYSTGDLSRQRMLTLADCYETETFLN